MKKHTGLLINIVLFTILIIMLFVLSLCVKGEWSLSGYVYSDKIKDIIRVFSLFVVLISIVLKILNRNKIVSTVLFAANVFALYKFLGTMNPFMF